MTKSYSLQVSGGVGEAEQLCMAMTQMAQRAKHSKKEEVDEKI
jgi:hypothetical protein